MMIKRMGVVLLGALVGACGPLAPGAPDGVPAPPPPVPPAPPAVIGPAPVVIIGGVAYTAETTRVTAAPPALRTTARASNATVDQANITFPDGCVVLIRAYRDPARTAPPSWDQSRAVACPLVLMEVALGPGQTRDFQATTTAREILGDSLPAGRYYFTAFLRPNGQPIEVEAGEADLRR